MLPFSFYILTMIFFAFIIKLIDYLYHNDFDALIESASIEPSYQHLRKRFNKMLYKKWDNILAFMLLISCYFFIFSGIMLATWLDNAAVDVLCVLFVTGRVRSLQEICHYSVHYALCPSSQFGMQIANVFYQYPWHMPSALARRKTHVKEHHNSVNKEYDPDLQELKDKNIRPGMTTKGFWIGLFYPLTLSGIIQRSKEIYGYFKIANSKEKLRRILTTSLVISLTYAIGSWKAVFLFYIVPALITYPLFYWIAHMALHRWYADCPRNIHYHEREVILGRPTNFKGIIGYLIKANIFPYGDSYHLAHSLFPVVRWNYLSKIDNLLKQHLKGYADNQSYGLIFEKNGFPSALSELKNRLVVK